MLCRTANPAVCAIERSAVTSNHPDPNPVRPSSAEGDPDEVVEPSTAPVQEGPDPRSDRPSQAEGEED